ncbi:MAG: S-layer homology domain-containing protein [Clostridia bacterium]|nr:S-layer homology domain-containing protein [Clostridia bacterium]
MKKTLSLFLSIIMLITATFVQTSVGAEEDLITDEVISGEVGDILPDTEESPEPTEEPTATPDADSAVSAEEAMHNIVEKYTTYGISEDINMHWFIADFVDYMSLYPESEYTLTDEEKQVCVDRIIESADNSTLQDGLAKSIIALRSLGYDPKNTYTKNGEALDIVTKLTDLITEESVTAPWYEYTLPYVMIALELCGGNEEKIEFLIETAISIKSVWQDTTYGTDGAAPMLRALAPYSADAEVAALIEETVVLVKSYQGSNGSMGNAASTGLAIAGLASVGVDPESVVKNGKDMLYGLMCQSNAEFDGFEPTDSSFATEQGLRGLIAWKLFADGKYIYDFAENPTDEARATLDIVPTPTPAPTEAPTPTPAPTRRPSYGGGGGVRTTPTPKPTATPAPTPAGLPGKNADVAEKPVIDKDKTFKDIKGHKNQAAIEVLASRAIIDGMDDVSYCPDNTMTRAQFATIVIRALGVPERDGYNFTDVNENDWFYSYVNTAYHYGIINGVSDTEFNPEGEITREEMVTMTARAAKLCGMMTDYNEESTRNTLAEFPDYITVSDWAMSAMAFCYYEKLLDGSVMSIEPKTKITRAEMAQLLYNMLGKAKLI